MKFHVKVCRAQIHFCPPPPCSEKGKNIGPIGETEITWMGHFGVETPKIGYEPWFWFGNYKLQISAWLAEHDVPPCVIHTIQAIQILHKFVRIHFFKKKYLVKDTPCTKHPVTSFSNVGSGTTKFFQIFHATLTTSHLVHTLRLAHHSKANHIGCSNPMSFTPYTVFVPITRKSALYPVAYTTEHVLHDVS